MIQDLFEKTVLGQSLPQNLMLTNAIAEAMLFRSILNYPELLSLLNEIHEFCRLLLNIYLKV